MLKKKVHILWCMWFPLLIVLFWQIYILSVVDSINYLERIDYVYAMRLNGIAKSFNLPSAYLKSLLILECSGKYKVPPRFEQGVFNRLKRIRDGKDENASYSGITKEMIHNATDEALRNMATSWGPFQIMGYHAVVMGLKVRNLRGFKSLYYGVKWIDNNYGDYLRAGKYKDAFHLHNAGKPFPASGIPATHNPDYVPRGLKYLKYFQDREAKFSSVSHRL